MDDITRRRQPREILVAKDGQPLTDAGNAERLVARYGEQLALVLDRGWYTWNGSTWSWDKGSHRAGFMALQTARHYRSGLNAEEDKSAVAWTFKSESSAAVASALALASNIPGIAVDPVDLDPDPYVLNTAGGQLVNLISGQPRATEPQDFCTQIAGTHYVPGARLPEWDQFVEHLFPDPELRRYMQRAAGYSLTGITDEEVMFLIFGPAKTGKNTFMEAILSALGGYAAMAAPALLNWRRNSADAVPTDLADLQGRRVVWVNEFPDQSPLDVNKAKQMVSTGTIKARFMRRDFFEFRATHKLWVTTNHLPRVKDQDGGIWRRLIPIPTTTIPLDQNPILEESGVRVDLKALFTSSRARPAILAWMIEGLRMWNEQALHIRPAAVENAVETYKANEDIIGQFLEDVFTIAAVDLTKAQGAVTNDAIWEHFRAWADKDREREGVLTHALLTRGLKEKGLEQKVASGYRYWPRITPKNRPQ